MIIIIRETRIIHYSAPEAKAQIYYYDHALLVVVISHLWLQGSVNVQRGALLLVSQ